MKSDPHNPESFSAKARARRMRQFVHFAEQRGISNASVLDIGGTPHYWEANLQYVPPGLIASIDLVNLPPRPDETRTVADVVLHSYPGDALDRSCLQRERYDVVYSNSLIEHVGNLRAQQSMATIIREVGAYFWIQTPAKSFPLEPHFYVPFFPYMPLGLRTFLFRRFRLGFMGRMPDWLEARMACEETRLLTKKELSSIFGDSDVLTERLIGFGKSYTATNMTAR